MSEIQKPTNDILDGLMSTGGGNSIRKGGNGHKEHHSRSAEIIDFYFGDPKFFEGEPDTNSESQTEFLTEYGPVIARFGRTAVSDEVII